MTANTDTRYQRIPFEEAIRYLADKITLPSNSWRDIRDDEHDAFFVIAGAKGSILSELREAVETAIRTGQRLEDFQPTFERIAEGWEYNGTAGWRSQVILQTNLRASYGRGREEMQLDPAVRSLQPYLRYIHGGSLNPRPHHLALDGQVFTAETMPWALPCGYGCTCRYVSLSSRRLEQLGLQPSTLRRGDIMPDGLPLEPDKGWDRQPGQARGARREELIRGVIDRSPPEIAQQIRADVAAYQPTAAPIPDPAEAAPPPPIAEPTPPPIAEPAEPAEPTVGYKPLMTEAEALEYTKDSVYQYTVYHGTTEAGGASITTTGVDVTKNGTAIYGQGFYTAKNYEAAQFYADNARDGEEGAILEMRVMVRNPKIVANRQEWIEYKASIGVDPYDTSAANAAQMSAALKERGFDAVEVVDDGYVCVLDPQQVAVFKVNAVAADDDFFEDEFS